MFKREHTVLIVSEAARVFGINKGQVRALIRFGVVEPSIVRGTDSDNKLFTFGDMVKINVALACFKHGLCMKHIKTLIKDVALLEASAIDTEAALKAFYNSVEGL